MNLVADVDRSVNVVVKMNGEDEEEEDDEVPSALKAWNDAR